MSWIAAGTGVIQMGIQWPPLAVTFPRKCFQGLQKHTETAAWQSLFSTSESSFSPTYPFCFISNTEKVRPGVGEWNNELILSHLPFGVDVKLSSPFIQFLIQNKCPGLLWQCLLTLIEKDTAKLLFCFSPPVDFVMCVVSKSKHWYPCTSVLYGFHSQRVWTSNTHIKVVNTANIGWQQTANSWNKHINS